jgi:cytochrome c peroxidase
VAAGVRARCQQSCFGVPVRSTSVAGFLLDPRMSPSGYMACVSCHQPDRAFTDAKARAHGLADLERNTIALANLRQQRWFGWGGARDDSLWMASLRPIFDPRV